MNCRHCSAPLVHTFIDLGYAPPSNAYLTKDDLKKPEIYYPLKVRFCDRCWLVQTEDYTKADSLFTCDYAYFSSTSSSWLEHAKNYSERMISELKLDPSSLVIEVASNDGYLLKNFVKAGIPCLGIEPTDSTAKAAEKIGVPVRREFFGEFLAQELAVQGFKADLIVGNNVYAHVPDINDFTKGLRSLLKVGGVVSLEFPHVMQLIKNCQFDTIYHEHFSYLSLTAVQSIFETHQLRLLKVERLPTHGGSLRVFGVHEEDPRDASECVQDLLREEEEFGLKEIGTYLGLQEQAVKAKNELLSFLIEQKSAGKTVVGYGAAAKGNTLLNFAGVKSDLLPVIADAASSKQGKWTPGSHIPIVNIDAFAMIQPDFVLVLPWNLLGEVASSLRDLRQRGCKLVTAIPRLNIV